MTVALGEVSIEQYGKELKLTVKDGLRLLFFMIDNLRPCVSSSGFSELESKLEDGELTIRELYDFLVSVDLIFSDEPLIHQLVNRIKETLGF